MANIYQKFKKDKLKEVILYILEKTGDISYYQLMKILFCSERVNLVACADPITDLKFKARQHGPVPNELYSEITKAQDGNDGDLNGIVEIMDKYNYLKRDDILALIKSYKISDDIPDEIKNLVDMILDEFDYKEE